MPTWNPALWNPANDDGTWAEAPLLGGAVGYLYYRTLNGNKLMQLWGEVIPPVPVAQNVAVQISQVPLAGTVQRWRMCWGTAQAGGLGNGITCLQLDPSGAVLILGAAISALIQAHIDVTYSIDL